MNPNIEDLESFQENVRVVSELYLSSADKARENIHILPTDEKTGIQAKEHANPKQPMKSGQAERIDPEYIRHGTTGLIASRDAAAGEIVSPLVQPARTEEDFALHIQHAAALNPLDKHYFILDNLNTHKSETLVRLIAKVSKREESSLGVKGKRGIIKNMESREAFLKDDSHQAVFVFTPKHCSWLNQIECWFGIITRRLLNKRASFVSVNDLEQKINNFIEYYNQYLKKPFAWNFKGNLLKV